MSTDNPASAKFGWLRQRWQRMTTLDQHRHVYLLLAVFNVMLVLIVLQGLHQQMLIREIRVIETREHMIVVTATQVAVKATQVAAQLEEQGIVLTKIAMVALTPTLTATPTSMPISATTPVASITPEPSSLILLGIAPNRMVRSDTGPPVPVTIIGANFPADVSVTLGPVPVTVLDTGLHAITGTVPISIPAGIHDLTVTNPGRQISTLLEVFTVEEP